MKNVRRAMIAASTCLLGSVALATLPEPAALRIVPARELSRCLPNKHLFENIEDRLFRSLDGRTVYLGPAPDRRSFHITGFGAHTIHDQPTSGKVYPDAAGNPRIWFHSLAEGVHFPQHFRFVPEDPVRTRFGVSYDAVAFYTVFRERSEVFVTGQPFEAVWSEDGMYLYRITATHETMILLGYRRLLDRQIRAHLALRLALIGGHWVETDRDELPDHIVGIDIDIGQRKILCMNESADLVQLTEYNMRDKTLTSRGHVEGFALYLHPEFKLAP